MVYRTAPFSMTLNNPTPTFQVRPFFDAEYLRNGCRYSYSYYERRIGTRMLSIKWCHFQWPWTNPTPIFKVTPLFGAKYLTNGYRYGHSYYRRRIGNRTQAFEWNKFQWPWVTSKSDLKVTIFFSFFLSYLGWHTLPSHVSAEACLTGWPNAQPQGRD